MQSRWDGAPAEQSAFARKARVAEPNARRELPALLRQLADTTTAAVTREAREALDGEREYIRAYVDRQMGSQFSEQLHLLKVQLSEFIRDFVEVKSAEMLGISASRESVRAEEELRGMQAMVEELQQSVGQLGAPPVDALLAQRSLISLSASQ